MAGQHARTIFDLPVKSQSVCRRFGPAQERQRQEPGHFGDMEVPSQRDAGPARRELFPPH